MAFSIQQGWCAQARQVPSPNYGPRPDGAAVDLLVVHNISLPPGEFGGGAIEQFFCNQLDCSAHPFFREIEGLEVSAHFLIQRTGELVQFVNTQERAWHAGVSSYQGRENCNDFSIGIELEGSDDVPYTDAQYEVLRQLTHALIDFHRDLTSERIVGHSDIAPGRKTDPGPAFDWRRFRTAISGEST
ncbi:1,6-anhydro-N-acetylmuramyl-L-alanine amidase AmpD [Parahalioglobus pacificus]|uniref:1,6-anhydro-N-acetylmuramyl-L-alanine amidase AmpD n=1 Tax=Parahalioglobus pacificus TaxID=930806 RepID=A0A919CHQ2_9GAMM|nr:1,6-anhydro-N-acetylmuramyl-L-alanine amidase AmpD [Halioglobus pacificus]NQY03109.1 1,6-anhydro-N-acetylmuramyl-L-alanine amidase AmpD [Halieaceae bacterium]GHD26108.1 N-acetyl-anhydromuranmyl-L-alanine amidase [Halioglobus pacificus]